MNSKAYQHSSQLSIGEVKTELKPKDDSKEQRQVFDAMSSVAHTTLTTWVIDNTTDPSSKGGKPEQISTMIEDSNGRQIAELVVSVPTTESYSKGLFEGFIRQGLVPAVQKVFRSYPSTRSGQNQIAERLLPDALEQATQVDAQRLRQQQTR